jgi:hypothetical protein
MKSAGHAVMARTFEIVFLVALLLAQMAFVMGGWWMWLEYTRTHA